MPHTYILNTLVLGGIVHKSDISFEGHHVENK